ncbi:MAG TPA: class I SAM-dependent methyltransferase [Bryobacteraceae bacterium]
MVELGTFYGESYFGFCQAIAENSIPCECYAVDTWEGDTHGGFYGPEIFADVQRYNTANYDAFSRLIRSPFDEALDSFGSESIDILHIDGHHSYEAVRHDFESWYPKVRSGGLILFHDIAVRNPGFGVWRLWDELARVNASFAFSHSFGLGIVYKSGGPISNRYLAQLLESRANERQAIADLYAVLGQRLRLLFENRRLCNDTPAPRCRVQVFYRFQDQYTEDNSAALFTEPGRMQTLAFSLPDGAAINSLRIDPADGPSVIDISRIVILVKSETIEVDLTRHDLTASGNTRIVRSEGGVRILSFGRDPQLYLPPLSCSGGPVEVCITLRIVPCVRLDDALYATAEGFENITSLPNLVVDSLPGG